MTFIHMHFNIDYKTPDVKEYQTLRATTNWLPVKDDMVYTALKTSLHIVCLRQNEKLIAMGRIIGDSGLYYYIQDIIVLPSHQKMGLGTQIMNELLAWLNKHAAPNSFIGLMAAKDSVDFYEKFKFSIRPANAPGMYMLLS